jgi:hypothetical protein
MAKEYEDMFVIVSCLIGAFVLYKIFIMVWNGSTVEGLQNRKTSQSDSGLAESSGANLDTTKTQVEALQNKLLLTNPTYNSNYSDKCSEIYDATNYMMAQTVANMDVSDHEALLQQLGTLNTLYQAKISLNDTLKFIDSVQTTQSK